MGKAISKMLTGNGGQNCAQGKAKTNGNSTKFTSAPGENGESIRCLKNDCSTGHSGARTHLLKGQLHPACSSSSSVVTYDTPWESSIAVDVAGPIVRSKNGHISRRAISESSCQTGCRVKETIVYDVPWEKNIPQAFTDARHIGKAVVHRLDQDQAGASVSPIKSTGRRSLSSINKELEAYGVALKPVDAIEEGPSSPPRSSQHLRLVVTADSPLRKKSSGDEELSESLPNGYLADDDQEIFSISLEDEPLQEIDCAPFGEREVDTPLKSSAPVVDDFGQSDALNEYPWFHCNTDRRQAETMIRAKPNGTFLVRQSEASKDYVLSVKAGGEVVHMKIEQDAGMWVVGTHSRPFRRIGELIRYYSKEKLPIYNVQHVRLCEPLRLWTA